MPVPAWGGPTHRFDPHWNMAIEARPEDFSLLAGLLGYAQCQDYERPCHSIGLKSEIPKFRGV